MDIVVETAFALSISPIEIFRRIYLNNSRTNPAEVNVRHREWLVSENIPDKVKNWCRGQLQRIKNEQDRQNPGTANRSRKPGHGNE